MLLCSPPLHVFYSLSHIAQAGEKKKKLHLIMIEYPNVTRLFPPQNTSPDHKNLLWTSPIIVRQDVPS